MISFLSPLALWVLAASLSSILIVFLVLVCRSWLGRWLSAGGRHSLWFVLLFCLLIPMNSLSKWIGNLQSKDSPTLELSTSQLSALGSKLDLAKADPFETEQAGEKVASQYSSISPITLIDSVPDSETDSAVESGIHALQISRS